MTSNAPERIWTYASSFKMWRDQYPMDLPEGASEPVQYTRTDLHQAEIAAVLEKAAEAAVSELHIDDPADYQQGMLDAEAAIRALIPDDVAAALQAEKDAARRDGIAIALKAVQQERREYPNNNPALPMDGVFNDIEDAIRQLKREVKK